MWNYAQGTTSLQILDCELMTPEKAAKKLLTVAKIPASKGRVRIWYKLDKPYLILCVDEDYPIDVSEIPKKFEGFKVTVEKTGPATALTDQCT